MKNKYPQIICILLLAATTTWAADTPKPDAPKTKLEQFSAKHGSLTLRASTEVAKMSWHKTGDLDFQQTFNEIKVEVVEIINPTENTRAYGLRFELSGKNSRKSISWLDADELPSLLKGIDYLLALDANVTKLASVTGFYRTRDGMEIQAVKGDESVFGVKASTGGFAVFEKDEAGLKKFRDAIVTAQTKIAEIKPE